MTHVGEDSRPPSQEGGPHDRPGSQTIAERNRKRREDHAQRRLEQQRKVYEKYLRDPLPQADEIGLPAASEPQADFNAVIADDDAVADRTSSDDKIRSSHVPDRNALLLELVEKAQSEAIQAQTIVNQTSESIATLTGSLVYNLKRFVEEFEGADHNLDDSGLSSYLDRLNVPRHGHDKIIFTRVARLLGNRINASLRNKVALNLAGACLLGIRSHDLSSVYKNGLTVGPRGAIKTGPSALGAAYKHHINRQNNQADTSDTDRRMDVQGGTLGEQSCTHLEAARSLSEALKEERIFAYYQGPSGPLIKIKRIDVENDTLLFIV